MLAKGSAHSPATPGNRLRSARAGTLLGVLAGAASCVLAVQARAQAGTSQCVTSHAEAQRLRLGGKLLDARTQLLSCAQRECPELVANDCALWLTEVESSLSSVVLAVEGASGADLVDVRVFANERLLTQRTDGRALPLDPGSYEFRFEAQGHVPLTVAASMRQSEKNRILRVRLQPTSAAAGDAPALAQAPATTQAEAADDTHPVPVLTYVLGGVALASFGAVAYFGLTGKEKYDELNKTCGRDRECTENEVEDGKRAYLIANVALGVGIASAVAAAIVYFAVGGDSATTASTPSAGLQAGVLDTGAYLQWSSRH